MRLLGSLDRIRWVVGDRDWVGWGSDVVKGWTQMWRRFDDFGNGA